MAPLNPAPPPTTSRNPLAVGPVLAEDAGVSYSSLYQVFRTKVRRVEEYRNGHGSGPPIWDLLWQNVRPGFKVPLFDDDLTPLWDLWKDPKVPRHQRLALQLTFDCAVCPPKLVDEMAGALVKCGKEILALGPLKWDLDSPPRDGWSWHHLDRIAADMLTTKLDGRALGFGLCCTSVSDPWFDGYPESRRLVTIQ